MHFKRAQWQTAQRGIEVQAERRIWRRCIRSLIGLFPSSRLLKRMFQAMDSELSAFCDRDQQLALFDQKLELMANLERVLSLGLAAAGVVLGVFDTSQFLLILFVSGRLIMPLRRTLRVWLQASRTVQGLQLFERVLKRSSQSRSLKRESMSSEQQVSPSPRSSSGLRLWLPDLAAEAELEALPQIRSRALVLSAEAPTLNGTLLENLTLGNPRLEAQALRFLSLVRLAALDLCAPPRPQHPIGGGPTSPASLHRADPGGITAFSVCPDKIKWSSTTGSISLSLRRLLPSSM